MVVVFFSAGSVKKRQNNDDDDDQMVKGETMESEKKTVTANHLLDFV